jgi:hypothetical protein
MLPEQLTVTHGDENGAAAASSRSAGTAPTGRKALAGSKEAARDHFSTI